jgi:hypothetical protein
VVGYGEDGLAIYADGTHEEHASAAASEEEHEQRQLSEDAGDSFGGHADSQPGGPQSVGLDFTFPFAQQVYGIPEHTTPLALPSTATVTPGMTTPDNMSCCGTIYYVYIYVHVYSIVVELSTLVTYVYLYFYVCVSIHWHIDLHSPTHSLIIIQIPRPLLSPLIVGFVLLCG